MPSLTNLDCPVCHSAATYLSHIAKDDQQLHLTMTCRSCRHQWIATDPLEETPPRNDIDDAGQPPTASTPNRIDGEGHDSTDCPECRSSDFTITDYVNRSGYYLPIATCDQCGRVYELEPNFSPEEFNGDYWLYLSVDRDDDDADGLTDPVPHYKITNNPFMYNYGILNDDDDDTPDGLTDPVPAE